MGQLRVRDHTGVFGELVNRPLCEIVAQCPVGKELLGCSPKWNGSWDCLPRDKARRRYVNNAANVDAGFVDAEKSVWLARPDATTDTEVRFAWALEMILAKTSRRLKEVANRTTKGE